MLKRLPVLFIFWFSGVQAQYFDYGASVHLLALEASEEESPFWMHSGKRGRVGETTSVAGWANISAKYFITPETFLRTGIGGAFQNGISPDFQLDEFFVAFENRRLSAFIGKQQKEELYNGLSATNENVLWSLNAEPLPGVGLEITDPFTIWKRGGLGIIFSWKEFLLGEKRYVDQLKVHHKSFHFVFDKISNIELIFGIQHFVQWGGISPDYGQLPQKFSDYLDVFVGKEGEDTVKGEEANALGNHLGSYEVYLNTSFSHYDVSLIYNTIFEDNSGRLLGNTPDGRYGIYFKDQNSGIKWVNAWMYEFYYTRDQSENTPTGDGQDNYFNNHLYRSGWTYKNSVLGVPFITLREDQLGIEHNNIRVHHIGLTGTAFFEYPYRFVTSFRENYGTKKGTEKPQSQILSSYLEVKIWQKIFDVQLQVGVDVNFKESSNVGIGIKFSKHLF